MKRRAIQVQSMNEVEAYASRLMSVAGMRGSSGRALSHGLAHVC